MNIKEAIPHYMRKLRLKNNEGTIRYYEQYFRFISEYIGDIDIDKLTKFDVEEMLEKKRLTNPDISDSSLNKYIQVTQALYFYMNEKRLNVSKIKEKKKVIPTISKETIKLIFDYYQNHLDNRELFRNYIYFRLSLDTGLRLNELVNVEMENIDLEQRTIHVTVTKTDEDRYVVFSEKTQVLLRKFIILYYQGWQYLFINFQTGNRISTSTIGSITQKLKKELKIKESISPHKWRHTFATNYVRKGGRLPYLTMILGHSNYRVTKKYVHPTVEDLVEGYIEVE
jgi:site-specific recombinase XerD